MSMKHQVYDRCVSKSHSACRKPLHSLYVRHGLPVCKLPWAAKVPSRPAALGSFCNSRRTAVERIAVHAANSDTSTTESSETDEYKEFANNIWQPVPPTPALGRKRKVALLLGCAMLEVSVTGGLMWAPLLGAIALAMLQPTKAEISQQQDEAIKQAVTAARIRMSRELPVTPVESAAWLNRVLQEMWAPFWQPFLLANNLNMWQDTVSAAAPRGWEVEIADVSMGTLAPEITALQAFADPETGTVTALDCKMLLESSDVRFVVVGRGPLGSFTARVSAVQVKGQIRVTPLLHHRMLLVAFKDQPNVRVSLSISAPLFKTALSPGDLGQLDFIQGLLGAAIKDMLVEPRRMAISLDYDIRVEEAVATTLHLTIDTLSGLPAASLGPAGGGSSSSSGASGGRESGSAAGRKSGRDNPRIVLTLVDTLTQVSRSTSTVRSDVAHRSAAIRQDLSLDLPRKQGLFRLEARDVSRSGKGSLMGSCLIWVAAARDGTTLFWSHDRSGAAVATRWSPSDSPWRISLPMTATGAAGNLTVHLGVSVEPWVYKQRVPGVVGQRTAGPRVVVLQVVEARGLSLPAAHGPLPNSHIQVCYDQECYSTATYYNSSSPVLNELFAFQENPGLMTRRVKLEVWHEGPLPAGSDASSSSSKGFGKRSASGFKDSSSSSSSGGKGFKSIGLIKGHSRGSRNSARHAAATAAGSNGGSSKVSSHRLPDIQENSDGSLQTQNNNHNDNNDVSSHMLFDVELEDDQSVEAEGTAQQQQQQSGSYDGSSSSSNGSSVSLGSAVVNLDQLTEDVIQDRWFALGGSDGGEVRLRMTVVPGTLPHRQRKQRSSAAAAAAAVGGGSSITSSSDDVCDLLSFFHRSLQGSSRDSLLVEVVSARLYLPLSSMDSSDVDQPAYMLAYDGQATITLPPHLQPLYVQQQLQQQQRSRSPKLIGGSSSSSGSSSKSRSSSRASSSSRQKDNSQSNSRLFDHIVQGNVSAQVTAQYCVARAVFPVAAAAAAAAANPGSSSSKDSNLGPTDSAGPIAAAATTAAADGLPQSGESASSAAVAGAAAAAAAGPKLQISLLDPDEPNGNLSAIAAAAAGSSPRSGSSVFSPSSSSSSVVSDIGSAEVDVIKLLHDSGVSLSRDGSSGGVSAAAAAASWEGWIKLNKDGGHLLLRLTQIPASQPADLAPPPAAATIANAAASSSTNGSSKPPVSPAAAAAAAAVNGAKADGSSGGSSRESDHKGLRDRLSGFIPDDLKHTIQKGFGDAESQVSGAVSQISDAAGSLLSSSSSKVGGWLSSLPAWAKPGSSSSSSNDSSSSSKTDSKQLPQQQQDQQQHDDQAAVLQQQQQQESNVLSSVDLAAIARSWGWMPEEIKQQQQQQQPRHQQDVSGFQPVRSQQQQRQRQQQHMNVNSDVGDSRVQQYSSVSSIMAAINDVLHYKPKPSTAAEAHKQQHQQQQQQQRQGDPDIHKDKQNQQQQQQQQRGSPVQRQTILLSPSDADVGIMHGSRDGGSSSSSRSTPTGSSDGADDAAPTAAAAAAQPKDTQPLYQTATNGNGHSSGASGASSNGSSSSNTGRSDLQPKQQQQQPVTTGNHNAGATAVGAAESAAASIGSNPLAVPAAVLHIAASAVTGSSDSSSSSSTDVASDFADESERAVSSSGIRSHPLGSSSSSSSPSITVGAAAEQSNADAGHVKLNGSAPAAAAAGCRGADVWSYDGDAEEEQRVLDDEEF